MGMEHRDAGGRRWSKLSIGRHLQTAAQRTFRKLQGSPQGLGCCLLQSSTGGKERKSRTAWACLPSLGMEIESLCNLLLPRHSRTAQPPISPVKTQNSNAKRKPPAKITQNAKSHTAPLNLPRILRADLSSESWPPGGTMRDAAGAGAAALDAKMPGCCAPRARPLDPNDPRLRRLLGTDKTDAQPQPWSHKNATLQRLAPSAPQSDLSPSHLNR
jgi:hypothetical protein